MMRTTRSRNFFGKIIVGGVNSSKTIIQNDCLMRLYDADLELKNISSELDSFDGKKDPIRCNLLVNRLRTSQDKVISLLFQLMDECNCERASRDYRMKFPDEILLSEGSESLNGQIWFGAECLSAGSNILNHSKESTMLRPMARTLTAHLDSLRNDLRDLVRSDGAASITRNLIDKMSTFDQIFSEFEYEYVRIMLPIRTVTEIEKLQEVAVLFSETLIDCVKRGLIKQVDIDEFQPIVMIAIPRLAIVRGLLYKNENPIYTRRKSNMCSLFQPFHGALHSIRKLLRKFNSYELFTLEKMLCDDQTAIEHPTSLENKKHTSDLQSAIQTPALEKSSDNKEYTEQTNDGCPPGTSNDNYANILMNGLSYPVGQKFDSNSEEPTDITASPSKFCDGDMDKPCSSSKLTPAATHRTLDVNVVQQNCNISPSSSSVASSAGSQRNPAEHIETCLPSSSQLLKPEEGGVECQYDSDYQLARLMEEFGPAMTDQEYNTHIDMLPNSPCDTAEALVSKKQELQDDDAGTPSTPMTDIPLASEATTISTSIKDKQDEERPVLEELFAKQTHQSLHKLFVAISGVADQLQSNFASDLRFILRHIFTSEIEANDDDDEQSNGNAESSDNRDSCDSDNENSEGSLTIEPAIEADETTNMSDLNCTYDIDGYNDYDHRIDEILGVQTHLITDQQRYFNGNSLSGNITGINNPTASSYSIYDSGSPSADVQQIQPTDTNRETFHDNVNLDVDSSSLIIGQDNIQSVDETEEQTRARLTAATSRQRDGFVYDSNVSPNDMSAFDEQHLQHIIQQQQQQIRDLSRANRLPSSRHFRENQSISSQLDADIANGTSNSQQTNVGVDRRSRHHSNRSRSTRQRIAPVWVPDHLVVACTCCNATFTWYRRRHHCRACGQIFCTDCSKFKKNLSCWGFNEPVRVCESCFNQ